MEKAQPSREAETKQAGGRQGRGEGAWPTRAGVGRGSHTPASTPGFTEQRGRRSGSRGLVGVSARARVSLA